MGYFDSDGNYQPDDSDYTPSYDAGGGGSSWGDNAPQLPPPSNFWGSLGDAIGGVAQQLQQGYDAGGGGSSWGDNQPDYSWTSPAPDYSQPDYSQPDYSTPSFDWGGGGSYWGDQQPSYNWQDTNPNADYNYWDIGQDFTAAEPTPQQLPDNTPFWNFPTVGFNDQFYSDALGYNQPAPQPQDNQGGFGSFAPEDLAQQQQGYYDENGVFWPGQAAPNYNQGLNFGDIWNGITGFFGNHSSGPTLYTPQAMFTQSQTNRNPEWLNTSLQRQQADLMAQDVMSGMGNTFSGIGQAVTNTGQQNIPLVSGAANFVRNAWENVADPVMSFTPSVVGDISQGQFPGALGDLWNYWTQPGYTQTMQTEKQGYIQDAYNQALQGGMTPEQAAQMAQQLDQKLSNPLNLAEYKGLQRFGTLPAIAQLGISLVDPIGNQFGEFALGGKLPKPLAETGLGKRIETGLGYVAPIPAAGKVAGLAADTFRLGDLGNYIGKKLESPQQKAHNFEMAQQDLTPTFEQIADQTGVSPLEVEQRFTSDPNFRQQLGFTGKYKQVGDDIAQSYREAEAQSYANKYEWDKAQPTEELKPDESKFATETQQTAATPAPDLVKQRDAYRSALKDEMAAKYEAEGMKPTEASVQAEIDSRQVTTKLRTPEAIEQFKKDYPTAYEKGQAKFEKQQTRNQAKATAKAEAAPKEEAEINAKREAYNQSLKEKYAEQFEKQGQDRGTALDNAAIRARVESDKLTSKKAIADFEKVNPDVVKNAENYLEFDTFKSGADQATQLKEKYASVQRPAHLKAMKVPKEWAALTPAERLDFAKQNYGLKVKALKVDEFGKVVPTKNLEQFGKAGKLLKGPGFLSEYMSRAMLNSPGRLVRDPAGNVVKAFLEGHNPFGGRKQGDILDRLGIERPEQLAGSIRKDLETSTKKPGFIKNAAYAAINPAGEAASLLVRKVTKGKIKDINEAVEHLETGIKGKVYDDAALKAYKQSIQSQLDNGILKNLTPELQKALQDGKLTREQIQQFAAGQLDKGNLAKAIDGDYHLQNYSPDITNTVDKLQDEGNIFASGVKDFFDELPGDVKPDSPEFRDAVQKARQYQDGVFTSFVKKEAEEIQKAKADPAVANAVQFPSFMKQVLENEQARRENYYQTFQGKDIISQREAVKGKAKPAQAAEPAPKKAEYTPTPDTVAYGTDPSKVYPLKFKVVSLDDLIPSNTDMGGVNPNYNVPGLQPRLRDRQASIRQIDQTAKKLNPDALLTDFKQLDKGAPITGPDKMVESGNGRTLALRKARTDYPEKWAEYQDKLKQTLPQYGIDPASLKGIKDPVLVRERSGNVTDRAAFAKEANESGTLRMSTLENAIQDAKLISDDQLLRFKVGEEQPIDVALRSASNRDFVRDFLGSLPENEAAALKRGDGSLNQQGLQRAKAAMLAKLFPGEAGTRLAETFLEALDSTTKNFENSITATMPKLSRMEALISSGQRDAKLSITSDVANAIDVLSYLKEAGIKPSDYLHQASFGIEGMEKKLTPFQDYLLDYFDTIGSRPKSIREFFNDYADAVEAAPDPNQSTMFGDFDRPTKEQLVERITGRKAPSPQADTSPAPHAELEGTGSTRTEPAPTPPTETPKAATVLRPAEGEAAEAWKLTPDKLLDQTEYNRNLRKTYFDESGEKLGSSRTTPQSAIDVPVGTWRIDDFKGSYGREISQLREFRPDELKPTEDFPDRYEDRDRYAQWMKEGKQPPPIEVVEAENGDLRVTDGNRRWAAAQQAGVPIRAWVSPLGETGKFDSAGKPIKTGLTYELAVKQAADEGKPVPPDVLKAAGVEAPKPKAAPKPKGPNKLAAYYDAIYNPVRSSIPAPGALRAMAAKFNRVDKAQRARYMQTFLDADENIRSVTGNTYKLDPQTFEPVRISDGKPLRESYLKQRAHINKQEPPEVETSPVETGKPAPETLLDPAKRQELLDLSEKVFGKGSDGAVKMQTALDTVSQKLNEFGIDPTKPFEKMTQAEKDLAMSIIARESGLPDATDVHVSYQSLKEQHAASSDLINQFQEDARKRYEQSQQAKVQKAEQAAQQRIDTERLVDQIAEAAATARARAVLDAKRAGFDEANRIYFDYNNKNILDQALTNWIPFNFWARQNFVYLAKHFAAHPMHFAALVNFYNQLQEENRKNGIPDYLRGDILLWTNPDGSKVMWNYSNMLPINPFGETDQTMNIVDATDADTSKSTNKTPLMVLFGYDKKNSKGEITGREKGVIPSFLRPNPIIDTVTKTGAISDFLNKMGYTTDRIGSPGPVEKQTLGLLPGRSMWQAVGAATGLTKELRKMIPGMSDLDIEGPINSYLFGKTSGKPMTALDQQLALMAQNKEISADQAKLAIAGIKEGNWTPAALAALDRIETKESMPMRILSIGGLSTVLTNTPREQSAKAVSQAYSQVDKGDKTAVKNFFDQNPGAEVSFSASKSPDEIRQGIKDGKTAQQLSQLTQQVKDKQISSKEYNAAVDKLKADNPGYKWKETTPEQTAKNQYFDQLDQYKAIGGDRYDQLSKEIQDKYNSGDKKGAAAISNSKEYQQMKAARDQFLKDNPDFADQYNKSITDKYGPQKPAKSEADATYQNQFDQYNNIGGGKWKDLTAQISAAQNKGDKKTVSAIMGSDEYQRLKNARDQFLLDHPDFYDQYKQELEAKGYKAPAIGSIKTSSNTPSSATSGRATSSYSRPAYSGGKSYTPTKKTYTTNYSSKSTYTTAKKPYTTSYSSKGASTYPTPKKAATTSYNASGPKSIEQIRTELRKPLALPKPSVYSESGYQKVTSSANKSSTLQSSAKYSRNGFKYLPPPKQAYSKGGGGKPSGKTYTRPGSSYSKNGIQLYSRGRGKF